MSKGKRVERPEAAQPAGRGEDRVRAKGEERPVADVGRVGASRGADRLRAHVQRQALKESGRGLPPPASLSRGEMTAAGLAAEDVPFFRDWLRQPGNVTALFDQLEGFERARAMLEHVEEFVRGIQGRRGDHARRGVRAARERFDAVALQNAQRARGARREALRSQESESEPIAPQRAAHEGDTEGEERWDPSWGDPDLELPIPLPQGMRRLPRPEERA